MYFIRKHRPELEKEIQVFTNVPITTADMDKKIEYNPNNRGNYSQFQYIKY